MYRCLIIDDEPLAINVLANYIGKIESLQLVDVTTKPLVGLEKLQQGNIDLVFLDIQMPEMDGITLIKSMEAKCLVILTTAYPEFALEGYEHNVVDYLVKPISFERFKKAIDKLPSRDQKFSDPGYIFIKADYKLLRIDHAEILFLESLRDYVAIHTSTGKKHLTLQSLSSFEKILPPGQFIRIHKSYIAAIHKITRVEKGKIMVEQKMLPVGDTYRLLLMEKLSRR